MAGEALRLSDRAVVHSYIATQAALPAHGYDKGIAEYGHLTPWTTPNLYRYYFRDSDSRPYFETNTKMVKHGIFRYFNVDDFALNLWIGNNAMKPDSGYVYHDGDNNKETYYEERGDEFRTPANTLRMPANRYEIFAFAAQARSLALGAEPSVNGFTRSQDLRSWGFNRLHYSHSRQFRSNILQERPYWSALATDFDLTLIGSNPQ